LINYDQSISQIVLMPKPPGTSPDTVSFRDSNPGHIIDLITAPGNPQIIVSSGTTGSSVPLLTITGPPVGSAPDIQATAGQLVRVHLADPGKRSNRTFAVVGPASGQGTLQVDFPTANVLSERLLQFPTVSSGTVLVRFRDGATYTVNYTNMNAPVNGSHAASRAGGTHQHRRPARVHGRSSAGRHGSASVLPQSHPASVLARSDGWRRGPLRIMPPAWRSRSQKK
jgi:hypothetical protein